MMVNPGLERRPGAFAVAISDSALFAAYPLLA
jgi:hypothetical protein